MKEKNFQKNIYIQNNSSFNKYINQPRFIRKVFYLQPSERKLRVEFCKLMKENNLSPENIFDTYESIFPPNTYKIRGRNKLRIS